MRHAARIDLRFAATEASCLLPAVAGLVAAGLPATAVAVTAASSIHVSIVASRNSSSRRRRTPSRARSATSLPPAPRRTFGPRRNRRFPARGPAGYPAPRGGSAPPSPRPRPTPPRRRRRPSHRRTRRTCPRPSRLAAVEARGCRGSSASERALASGRDGFVTATIVSLLLVAATVPARHPPSVAAGKGQGCPCRP